MTSEPGASAVRSGARLVAVPGGRDPAVVSALRRALESRLRGDLVPGDGPAPVVADSQAGQVDGVEGVDAVDGLDGLDGSSVLVPHDPDETDPLAAIAARLRTAVPAGTAVILRTSGSTTGTGHLVALSAAALVASARATHERLGGPGRWVLAVPAHHVAGLQVLVRSVVAGTAPVLLDTSPGFDPAALAEAVAAMPDDAPGYLSLVPTQLVRVLDAGPRAVVPLRRLAAILVGGAATPTAALAQARAAGLRVVTTYGMTETGGGCVYDGVPLPGVRVRTTADGRVEIAGAMLASGYLDDADGGPFAVEAGERWLRTSDRGRLDRGTQGVRLTVLGRVDDLINTGAVKVSPTAVERLAGPGVVVVGVPDDEWGELVTAVTTAAGSLAELRAAVSAELGAAHAPRALVRVDALPLRGPGKVDRLAVVRLAREALAEPGRRGVERHGVKRHANDGHGTERHANDGHGVDRDPRGADRPIS